MANWVLLFLIGTLLAILSDQRILPWFRVYLVGLSVGLMLPGTSHIYSWVCVIVLLLKLAATIEAAHREFIDYIWFFYSGIAIAFCSVAWGFAEQYNLMHPSLIYIKHLGQVFLAAAILSIALFRSSFPEDETDDYGLDHCWLMTILWMNYAVVGIIPPHNRSEWEMLNRCWTIITCITFLAWIQKTLSRTQSP